MNKQFKSNNFIFRPTALAEALAKASEKDPHSFTREPKAVVINGKERRVLEVS